jgi:SAM-dependent methyltransferase
MPFGKGVASYVPNLTLPISREAEELVQSLPKTSIIVDLGAGGRRIAPHVKTVDAVAGPDTDFACDVARTPFADASVDCVIATGLLEHVPDDHEVLREIHRVLRMGGIVHIEAPFLQQFHADPIDYRRYTESGLAEILRRHGFSIEKAGWHIGPTVTMLTLASYYVALLFEGQSFPSRLMSNGAFVAFRVIAWPFKYLDRLLVNKPSAQRLAFSVYCRAVKIAG